MYGEPLLKDSFVKYYNEIVKPIGEKCTIAYAAMVRIENSGEVIDDSPDVALVKTLKDPLATWYVGLFMGDVARAKIQGGMRFNLINSFSQIHDCLNNESYWANVWGNDFTSDEAKNLRELAEVLKVLMTKL